LDISSENLFWDFIFILLFLTGYFFLKKDGNFLFFHGDGSTGIKWERAFIYIIRVDIFIFFLSRLNKSPPPLVEGERKNIILRGWKNSSSRRRVT
jgi:hypothetical protein